MLKTITVRIFISFMDRLPYWRCRFMGFMWFLWQSLKRIESTTYCHRSDLNEESLSNIPGIIFKSRFYFVSSNVTVTFDPVYIYNETMYGQEGSNILQSFPFTTD